MSLKLIKLTSIEDSNIFKIKSKIGLPWCDVNIFEKFCSKISFFSFKFSKFNLNKMKNLITYEAGPISDPG